MPGFQSSPFPNEITDGRFLQFSPFPNEIADSRFFHLGSTSRGRWCLQSCKDHFSTNMVCAKYAPAEFPESALVAQIANVRRTNARSDDQVEVFAQRMEHKANSALDVGKKLEHDELALFRAGETKHPNTSRWRS